MPDRAPAAGRHTGVNPAFESVCLLLQGLLAGPFPCAPALTSGSTCLEAVRPVHTIRMGQARFKPVVLNSRQIWMHDTCPAVLYCMPAQQESCSRCFCSIRQMKIGQLVPSGFALHSTEVLHVLPAGNPADCWDRGQSIQACRTSVLHRGASRIQGVLGAVYGLAADVPAHSMSKLKSSLIGVKSSGRLLVATAWGSLFVAPLHEAATNKEPHAVCSQDH